MTESALLTVDRAIDDLRRGRPVVVTDGMSRVAAMALDLATDDSITAFESNAGSRAHLLISGRRAQVLKITSDARAAGHQVVMIEREPRADLGFLLSVADPVEDLAVPLKGPFRPLALGAHEAAAQAAIELAKNARLLPSCLIVTDPSAQPDWLEVRAETIMGYAEARAARLKIVAQAKVPLADAESARIVAFRADDGALEHLAIIIGEPNRHAPVLSRLHSECFTGDLLASLKCDCGPQLRGALKAISEHGSGVLLYLAQEGRGIGLINKLRAYALQDQGFDTVDANHRLGFETDERAFWPAARMLTLLGFTSVRLMTNNPQKVAGLEACGIRVAERVPHQFPANPHNAGYLKTKQQRTGHLL
ncbi:GTP cyclohydrolase II [Pedomonas mirosovicensis]|uniref:GTP cyclohydrolase II n=1 Tax=Pedomonas mirosovicensis TaxID=2908641 RepID=UPI00216808B7|nr:GTP cyclohydrolase II [Pedomonas mirosovicensis]MCH8684125.1 GTP cyclohydrolase II [Pedomonas mirosovicensis]